jgi:hypothetical protein
MQGDNPIRNPRFGATAGSAQLTASAWSISTSHALTITCGIICILRHPLSGRAALVSCPAADNAPAPTPCQLPLLVALSVLIHGTFSTLRTLRRRLTRMRVFCCRLSRFMQLSPVFAAYPLRCSLSMRSPRCRSCSFLLSLCTPFLCVLSGHLPFCHSVPWDSLPLHGLCPRSNCTVCITLPPLDTAGGYTSVERRGTASSFSISAARLPRLIARILLIRGLISWNSCLVTPSRPRGCAGHCMLTLF